MATTYAAVSLLRAINVGKRQVDKDRLIAIHEAAGCSQVRTYLASGNVLFLTTAPDLKALSSRIQERFERETGFTSEAILRTADELDSALARNPFNHPEPARLLVTFLASAPSPIQIAEALTIPVAPEQMAISGREMYVYYPNGIGRSKFPDAKVARALGGIVGTSRNLNTVRALSTLVRELGHNAS